MPTPKNLGRLAGAFYLLSAIAAGIPLIYVPGTLVVDGNAAATFHNILANEAWFRTCMASELLGALLLMTAVFILRQLLRATSESLALLMVTLALLSVPITFVNSLTESAALDLFQGAPALAALGQAERNALAMLCLNLHDDGANIANIFWGLWLLPFGVLVAQSRALPRVLGFWLIADCFALVTVSLTNILDPPWADVVNKAAIPAELGELAVMLWLLVKGARPPQPTNARTR
jgi:hypothetical protein